MAENTWSRKCLKTGEVQGFKLRCDRKAVAGSNYCLQHQSTSKLKAILREREEDQSS